MLKEEESYYKLKNSSTYLEFQKIIDNIKNKTVSFVNDIIKSKKQVFALGAVHKGKYLLQHFGLNKTKIPFISERNGG